MFQWWVLISLRKLLLVYQIIASASVVWVLVGMVAVWCPTSILLLWIRYLLMVQDLIRATLLLFVHKRILIALGRWLLTRWLLWALPRCFVLMLMTCSIWLKSTGSRWGHTTPVILELINLVLLLIVRMRSSSPWLLSLHHWLWLFQHLWEVNWQENWLFYAVIWSKLFLFFDWDDALANFTGSLQAKWLLVAVLSWHECICVSCTLIINVPIHTSLC